MADHEAYRAATKLQVAEVPTPTIEPANSLRKPAAPKDLAAIAADIPTPAAPRAAGDDFGRRLRRLGVLGQS